MSFWGFGATEKAIGMMDNVAKTGMKIWDNKNFTAQDTSEMFLALLDKTKSQATSISRRHLLWFIMLMTGLTLFLAIFYNAMGMSDELEGLIVIIDTWKISWAFVSAVTFYYLTQFSGVSK